MHVLASGSMKTSFRNEYLDYDALTVQIHAWAQAYPGLVRAQSIGKSAAGRDLWVLTIGPEPDRLRPAVWVDGLRLQLAATSVAATAHATSVPVRRMRWRVDMGRSPEGFEALTSRTRAGCGGTRRWRGRPGA